MTTTSPASMGGPLSEADRLSALLVHASEVIWAALGHTEPFGDQEEARTFDTTWKYLGDAVRALSNGEALLDARVGVLEGQLATAREEAAADKAKLAELEGSTCQACGERTVRLQTEVGGSWTHHDGVNCWNRCADNPGKVWPQAAPGNEGWRGAYMHAQTLLEEAMRRIDALEPSLEMPRPPAVEAHSGPENAGTGSGMGTGVAEADGAQETEQHWLKFNKNREVSGCSCGFKADLDSDCGWGDSVVAHLIAVGHAEEAAALKESIRLDRAPSLPAPSAEDRPDYQNEPEGADHAV